MKVTREIFYFKLSAGSGCRRRCAPPHRQRISSLFFLPIFLCFVHTLFFSFSFFLSLSLSHPAGRETSYIAIIPEKEEAILRETER